MFRFTILAAVLFAMTMRSGAVTEEEFAKSCGAYYQRGLIKCCNMDFSVLPEPDKNEQAIVKECLDLPAKTICDREICMATKRGVALEDGTLIKPKLTELVEKNLGAFPELVTAVKDKCIDGDISKYGPADLCDVVKNQYCSHIQTAAVCPKWDDEQSCAGAKEAAATCVKLFQ